MIPQSTSTVIHANKHLEFLASFVQNVITFNFLNMLRAISNQTETEKSKLIPLEG